MLKFVIQFCLKAHGKWNNNYSNSYIQYNTNLFKILNTEIKKKPKCGFYSFVETNPGPRRPVTDVCRILCSNVRGLAGNLSDLTVSVWNTVVLWDFGLTYASRVGGAGSRFRSPCLVVSGQDASGPWDRCVRSRWLRSISSTQIWVWLLRNAGV